MTRTVKCRIALAVNSDGEWAAFGHHTSNEDGAIRGAMAYLHRGSPARVAHRVEVEVPIPTVDVIRAEAEEVSDGDR